MLSPNHYSNQTGTQKPMTPLSPQTKRKVLDYPVHSPTQSPTPIDFPRKDPVHTPHTHFNSHPLIADKSPHHSREQDFFLDTIIQSLTQKQAKLSNKLSQHESILIKLTESSIQNNKDSYKRSRPDLGKVEIVSQTVGKMRREFEELRTAVISRGEEGQARSREVCADLVSKSQHKMREQMREQMREEVQKAIQKYDRLEMGDARLDEIDIHIKRLQKGMALNSGKIADASERIDSTSSGIEGHMELINAEVNKAIAKIVNFVNDKVSKPLTDNIDQLTVQLGQLTTRFDKETVRLGKETEVQLSQMATQLNQLTVRFGQQTIQLNQLTARFDQETIQFEQMTARLDKMEIEAKMAPVLSHFGGLKSSGIKSHKEMTRADYRESLSSCGQELTISQATYYIDSDSYLLDRQFCYLIHNDERIQLNEGQIQQLMNQRLLD